MYLVLFPFLQTLNFIGKRKNTLKFSCFGLYRLSSSFFDLNLKSLYALREIKRTFFHPISIATTYKLSILFSFLHFLSLFLRFLCAALLPPALTIFVRTFLTRLLTINIVYLCLNIYFPSFNISRLLLFS